MKIMLLGGHGLLGQAFQQVLAFQNLLVYGRKTLDVTDPTACSQELYQIDPDIVINCAGFNRTPLNKQEEDEATLVNTHALGHLAHACNRRDAVLVHISTSWVFGQEYGGGYTEANNPENPLTFFGRTKLLGENLVKKFAKKYYIIRTSSLFGPGKNTLVDEIVQSGRANKQIKMSCPRWTVPSYSLDVAREIWQILREKAPYGVYHVVNSTPTMLGRFATEILELCEIAAEVQHVPAPDDFSPKKAILISNKRQTLRSWHGALREYLVGTGAMKLT